MKPFLLVNFKTYAEGTGKKAVRLAKACQTASARSKVPVIVSVQAADISEVARNVRIPVWAQHADNVTPGRNTGFITPESIRLAGAGGTLLNHAEHKLDRRDLKETIEKCRKLKLATMVCAATKREAAAVARFRPDFIAVEPPELIGTGISVSAAKPEIVRDSVRTVRKVNRRIPVVCGAGITTGEDVRKALELGSRAALVASGVVKAGNPGNALKSLVRNLK